MCVPDQGAHYNVSNSAFVAKRVNSKVKERYEFSKYLIDTNKFIFRKVVRVLALVLMFIKRYKQVKFSLNYPGQVPNILKSSGDKYVLTPGRVKYMGSECSG